MPIFTRLKRNKIYSVPLEVGREDEFESDDIFFDACEKRRNDDASSTLSENSNSSTTIMIPRASGPSKQEHPFDPSVFRTIVKRPLRFAGVDDSDNEEENHSLDSTKSSAEDNDDDDDEKDSIVDFIVEDDDQDEEDLSQMMEKEEALHRLRSIHRAITGTEPQDAFFTSVEYCVRALLDPSFQMRVEKNHLSEDYQKFYADSVVRLWYQATDRCESWMESAIWLEEFSLVIDGYPFIHIECVSQHHLKMLPKEKRHCQVCRRRNHPTEYAITFYGNTYNPDATMEGTESFFKREKDARQFYTLPLDDIVLSKQRILYVGKYCTQRVRVYHALRHWVVLLLLKLRDRLDNIRGPFQERVRAMMEDNREFVEALYQKYKAMVETADKFSANGGPRNSAKYRTD